MDEAAWTTGSLPGSGAWGAQVMGQEESSAWARLLASGEEQNLEQETGADLSQEARGMDWGPDPQDEADAGLEDGSGTAFEAGEVDLAGDGELPVEDEVAEGSDEPAASAGAGTPDRVPFFEHELYVEAMHALAFDQGDVAVSNLRELADLYPDEAAISDLLVRMELKSAVAQERELPANRRQAAPALQNALTLLLLVTLGLVGLAGFYLAFQRFVIPIAETNREALEIQVLEAEIARRWDARDWNGAIQTLQELERRQPGSEQVAEKLAYAERQKQLGDWYADAVAAENAGDVEGALVLLQQIAGQEPGYQDVEQRLQKVQTLQALGRDWLEAEARVQAEDWQGATALLLEIRRLDPDYRRDQVTERLFQIYERLARQSLNQANGDPEGLRQALVFLNGALAERPTNQDLGRERALALRYIRGSEAQARGDWLEAAEQWEAIHKEQPGYQGAVLEARLKEAYPRAARQAIAEAGGSVERLKQAAAYLDRALADSPEDDGLRQDRELVAAYLDGAEAFGAGFWDQAIRHWGPLYAAQPGYQNGALERNLRTACGASTEPDLTLCPP